jgi:N-acetylmuramoyl-L-alanine amidase
MNAPMVLGIDCGHGGDDLGTQAGDAYDIVESYYVRDLGEQLLGSLPHDICRPIILTDHSETVGLSERAARARWHGCDLVLSLHVNASLDGGHGGHMLYRPDDDESRRIAYAIAEAWPPALRRHVIGYTMQSGRYVAGGCEAAEPALWPRAHSLVSTYDGIPTVLVEGFYATHGPNCVLARDPWVQLQMVAAMMRGIAVAGQRAA